MPDRNNELHTIPAYPEFCSTYKIMNVNENHNIYTDKLQINAIDLTNIDLASEVVYNFTENHHIKKYLEQRARLDKISLETLPQRLEAENARLEKEIKKN